MVRMIWFTMLNSTKKRERVFKHVLGHVVQIILERFQIQIADVDLGARSAGRAELALLEVQQRVNAHLNAHVARRAADPEALAEVTGS